MGSTVETHTSKALSSESPLYSQLHLALLESLLECNSPSTGLHHGTSSARETISAQHLAAISEPILRWIKELSRMDTAVQSRGESALQLSLDRLAQFTQVALVSHCIYGNLRKYMINIF